MHELYTDAESRMIVPVYQSEISPAENRGKLACIEFTGNIVGYASSVVRSHPPPPSLDSHDLNFAVDRLLCLLPHLRSLLAYPPRRPMHHRTHPRRRYPPHPRVSKMAARYGHGRRGHEGPR
jgi:hypothetical protein